MSVRLLIVIGVALGLLVLGASAVMVRDLRLDHMAATAMAEGRAAVDRQDWPEACVQFKRVLSRNPEDIEILGLYAKAEFQVRPLQARNVFAAIGAYRQLLLARAKAGDVPRKETYEQLARLYELTGDQSNVIFIASQALEQDSASLRARLWLAKALIAQRKPEEARSKLSALVEVVERNGGVHSEYVQACILMSTILARDNSGDDARESLSWLQRALNHDPRSVDALLQRAALYRSLAHTPNDLKNLSMETAARADLEAADELRPGDPVQRLVLAEQWLAIGDLDRAASDFKLTENVDPESTREVFLDPDDWVAARFQIGAALALRLGTSAESVSLADTTLTRLTKKRQRLLVLPQAIRLYAAGDRIDAAKECLDEFVTETETPDSTPQLKRQLATLAAIVARAEGQPYKVIEQLEPIAGNADDSTLLMLAQAYQQTGQTSRALPLMSRLAARSRADKTTLIGLARLRLLRNDWKGALQALDAAQVPHPNDVDIRLLRVQAQLGVLEHSNQKIDEQLAKIATDLAELKESHPQRVAVRILQARVYELGGRTDEAQQTLRLALGDCENALAALLELSRFYERTDRRSFAIELCRGASEEDFAEEAPVWLRLSQLLATAERYDEATTALADGALAMGDSTQGRVLERERAELDILHGDRSRGIAELHRLASEDVGDLRTRNRLLGLPEVLADSERSSKIVDEIRAIEGETGLMWRLHKARLLLNAPRWRDAEYRSEIESWLRYCVDAAPSWASPVLLLGQMYEALALIPDAERLYRRFLGSNSAEVEIAFRLIALLKQQDRSREALELVRRIDPKLDPHRWSEHSIKLSTLTGDDREALRQAQLRVTDEAARADDWVVLAQLIYRVDKDAARAYAALDKAESREPNSINSARVRVGLLRTESRDSEAERILDELVARRKDLEAHYLRALFFREIGDKIRAEAAFKQLPIEFPTSHAYTLSGQYFAWTNRVDLAIETWKEGLTRHPNDLGLERAVARAMVFQLQSDAAADRSGVESLLLALRDRLPLDAQIVTWLGMVRDIAGDPNALAEARSQYEKAIELNPWLVDPHVRLARLLIKNRDYGAARRLLIRALEIHPGDDRLNLARAMAEIGGGRADAGKNLALQLWGKNEDPAILEVLVRAAVETADLELLAGLQEPIQRRAADRPEIDVFQTAQVMLLADAGRVDAALTAHAPQHCKAAALRLYRTARDVRGEEAVVERYRVVLKLNPDLWWAQNDLAWKLAAAASYPENIDQLNEAERLARQAVSHSDEDPNPGNLHDTLAEVLAKFPDRLAEARTEFEKAVELFPADAPAFVKGHLKLARLCLKLKEYECVERSLEILNGLDRSLTVPYRDEIEDIRRLLPADPG